MSENQYVPHQWILAAQQSQPRNRHKRNPSAERKSPLFSSFGNDTFSRKRQNHRTNRTGSASRQNRTQTDEYFHQSMNYSMGRDRNFSGYSFNEQFSYSQSSWHHSFKNHSSSSTHCDRKYYKSSAHERPRSIALERPSLHRKWEHICKRLPYEFDFKILSYNILSQKLLRLNSFLYRNIDNEVLEWANRWKNLKREIRKFKAEVLCLQEIEEIHYLDEIKPFLEELGYKCFYKRRTSNNPNMPDGVLTAFKSKKFKVLYHKNVEYNRPQLKKCYSKQQNVAVIIALESVESGAKMLVANTHLLYNPKRGDIKLLQASILLTEVHAVLQELHDENIPVMLCGDFNSTPGSHLSNFIMSGCLNYTDLASKDISGQKVVSNNRIILDNPFIPEGLNISHNCRMAEDENAVPDVLKHSLGEFYSGYEGDELKRASTTQDNGVIVDFIYYSKPKKNKIIGTYELKLLSRLKLVEGKDIAKAGGLPNANNPSDHLPIIGHFAVKKYKT